MNELQGIVTTYDKWWWFLVNPKMQAFALKSGYIGGEWEGRRGYKIWSTNPYLVTTTVAPLFLGIDKINKTMTNCGSPTEPYKKLGSVKIHLSSNLDRVAYTHVSIIAFNLHIRFWKISL